MNERSLQDAIGYCSRKMNELAASQHLLSMDNIEEYGILLTLERCATKQKPVLTRYDEKLKRNYCPSCNKRIKDKKYPIYCEKCGQLLINRNYYKEKVVKESV